MNPLLSLPPFFASLLPLFPQKRLILRLDSLRGRRLKGKGKRVLGARETQGAREEGEGREIALLNQLLNSSLLARPSRFPRAPNPFSLRIPFQTPATQATG